MNKCPHCNQEINSLHMIQTAITRRKQMGVVPDTLYVGSPHLEAIRESIRSFVADSKTNFCNGDTMYWGCLIIPVDVKFYLRAV